jgi:hypothetical protein
MTPIKGSNSRKGRRKTDEASDLKDWVFKTLIVKTLPDNMKKIGTTLENQSRERDKPSMRLIER